jgi:hypothetical protein
MHIRESRRHEARVRRPIPEFVAREAVAGAQRRRFVGATERGERFGGHAGRILGPWVIRAESCLMCRQSSLRKGRSLSVAPCVEKEACVITLMALWGDRAYHCELAISIRRQSS